MTDTVVKVAVASQVLYCVHCGSRLDDGCCAVCNLPPDLKNLRKVLQCGECNAQLGEDKQCTSCGCVNK